MNQDICVLDEVPSYAAFCACMQKNVPVVLPAQLTASWPAFRRFVRADGGVHWDALRADYGDHHVPVVIDGCERKEMALSEALDLINKRVHTVYIKDWHLVRSARTDAQAKDRDRLMPYRTPDLFADDCTSTRTHSGMNNVTTQGVPSTLYPNASDAWLAACNDAYEQDDFRFCYAGTKGSFTPLHRDGTHII